MTDIAVIGAGIAGLVCAQQLSQAGYSVLVVEKSRGLGGRLATRRLHGTWADHGACYLKPKGELLGRFVEILLNQRVIAITPTPENSWRLTLESSNEELTAKALVVAIPAPQTVMLLSPLGESVLDAVFLDNLRSVEFYPSISA